MRFGFAGFCLLLAVNQGQANELWTFDHRISVTDPPANGVFHHLDGAGRKHISVSGDRIAVAWEDNRSGEPQVYVVLKSLEQETFPAALQGSDGNEAFEPSIGAISGDRFVLVFEQDASIFARVLTAEGLFEPARLSRALASHASIASFNDRVFASWREQDQGKWSVKVAQLRVNSTHQIGIESVQSVEVKGLEKPVLFPVIAVNEAGLCVAWEDRREGNTRLLVSHADSAGMSFTEPENLNEFFSDRTEYDRGNGVTRVSMASFGRDEILTTWMDKRRPGVGYGIFAAIGAEAGKMFGPNEKVHGEAGDKQPHYNPATAGNPNGDFAVAWDDFRRGDSDIWINTYNADSEWNPDFAPLIASGVGEQSHPSITLDKQGNLHLLWIERDHLDGPSRLWYGFGRRPQPQ